VHDRLLLAALPRHSWNAFSARTLLRWHRRMMRAAGRFCTDVRDVTLSGADCRCEACLETQSQRRSR
jgi:hypothetical protein